MLLGWARDERAEAIDLRLTSNEMFGRVIEDGQMSLPMSCKYFPRSIMSCTVAEDWQKCQAFARLPTCTHTGLNYLRAAVGDPTAQGSAYAPIA